MQVDRSVPGQMSMRKPEKARSPRGAKVVDSVEIRRADNGGFTAQVRERYERDDEADGDDMPRFIEPKTYVYKDWAEASGALSELLAAGEAVGAAEEVAEAEGLGTMADLAADVGAVVGSEEPDSYRSMRG